MAGPLRPAFVYVLRNDAIPGLVKVGFSYDPDMRARDLSTSGVPGSWKTYARFVVSDARSAENAAHTALGDRRENKEFFRISAEEAAGEVVRAVEPWHCEGAADDWQRYADPEAWEAERREAMLCRREAERRCRSEVAEEKRRREAKEVAARQQLAAQEAEDRPWIEHAVQENRKNSAFVAVGVWLAITSVLGEEGWIVAILPALVCAVIAQGFFPDWHAYKRRYIARKEEERKAREARIARRESQDAWWRERQNTLKQAFFRKR
jgi:hypothetical protein